MKSFLSALLITLFFIPAQSQDLRFEIRSKSTSGVSKEKLSTAKTMVDIRPGYPSSMIEKYTSTEISVRVDGNVMQAKGENESLSSSQQNLLQVADVGSDINVEIGYLYHNPVTLFPDIRQMHFTVMVVPEVEATYPGGHEELTSYLEKNAIDKIRDQFSKEQKLAVISFTVNEDGKITDAYLSESSKDPVIDELLLKAINNMPRWKPARDAEGRKVRQSFEFAVGNGGC